MRLVLVFALLVLPVLAGAAEPQPAGYRVHDLTPTFWRYWDEAHALPEAEQVRLLQERVVAAHPQVYTAKVLGLSQERPLGEELAGLWPRFRGFAGPHLALARELSGTVGRELPGYDARFRRAFPDFAYTGDVYFMVSLGAFDGATRQVQGRTALLFGVDVMAVVYGKEADPASFFHHELFHIYHGQFPDKALSGTLARALWGEGLAVYVAEQLNPGTPEPVLFGLPRDMPERARARLPALASGVRRLLDSRSREDYERYFTGKHDSAELPGRVGYYLGYRVVKEVAGKRSLRELARLKGPALRRELDRALARLAAGDAR